MIGNKIIPVSFREGQNEYFLKKTKSLAINVLFTKNIEGILQKKVDHTIIYRCDQDVLDTLCVSQHVLLQIKKDLPNLKFLYQRSDNAGCYSGNSVAEIMYNICKNAGITLKRYDNNEPQMGKDQADQESAVAKCYTNSYIHAGHNLLLGEDVKKGIMYLGGPEDTKVSVVEIDSTKASMTESIIKNIQSYHSISFEKKGMTFHQYFNCGKGKFVNYSNLEF